MTILKLTMVIWSAPSRKINSKDGSYDLKYIIETRIKNTINPQQRKTSIQLIGLSSRCTFKFTCDTLGVFLRSIGSFFTVVFFLCERELLFLGDFACEILSSVSVSIESHSTFSMIVIPFAFVFL